jgi:hypothetical protein
MNTFLRHFTTALALMFPCHTTMAASEKPADPLLELHARMSSAKKPAVLFVGNSYSFNAPREFRTYASNRGKQVRVEQVTTGGWTLARHAANEKTLKKIREGHFDVVVIQEHSRIPSLPSSRREKLMAAPLHQLVDQTRKQGAIPVLYQTWGYRDGDRKLPDDDFHAMTRRLREGYQTAGKTENIAVVPVGDAWEREFSAGNSGKLFMPDGSHPSPYGNAVTARVFFETLFPQKR